MSISNINSIEVGRHSAFGFDSTSANSWAWGGNRDGALGNNSTNSQITPVAICGSHTFCKITGNNRAEANPFSLGIDTNGNLWSWGLNYHGQLGTNNTTCYCTPVAVCGGHYFCYASGGDTYSIGIDSSGQAWGWGSSQVGQLEIM